MWTCCLSCSIALYLITNSFILAHFSWSGSHLAGRWVWGWLPVHLKMRSAWMPIVLSRWKRKPAFKCGMRGAECEGTISSCYFSSIWMEGKRRQLRVIKLNAATVPLIRFPRATVRMFSDDWGIDYSGARITHLWQMWYEREFISLFWFFVVVFFFQNEADALSVTADYWARRASERPGGVHSGLSPVSEMTVAQKSDGLRGRQRQGVGHVYTCTRMMPLIVWRGVKVKQGWS